MTDWVWVVLGYYSDGSDRGRQTLLAAFKTQRAAERLKELVDQTTPSKTIEVVPMELEP